MKLMFIILRDQDEEQVLQGLVEHGYRVTRMASTGGFLRHGNITLMTGVEGNKVTDMIELLRQICGPEEKDQHRATIFVVDMPFYEQI